MLTNLQFVEFITKAYESGYVYWYGTYGKKCTKSLYDSKKKQYPEHYGSSRTAKYMKQIEEGRTCADCIGLAKNFVWSDGIFGNNPKYAVNGMPDKSANGMFEYAVKNKLPHGSIDTIPNTPGIAVRYNGHVGYSLGNGYVIEERGFNYGCVKTKLAGRGWTDWYQLPGITYVEEKPASTDHQMIAGYIKVRHGNYYIRKAPEKSAPSIGITHEGDSLPYLGEQSNSWYKVRFDGQEGWVSSKAGDAVTVSQKTLTVKSGSWYVRSAPNAKAKVLGTVKGGDKLIYQDQDTDGWKLVIFENQNGYISSKAIVKE